MSIHWRLVGALAGLFVAWRIVALLVSWRSNIEKAKRSGIPYIITPFQTWFLPWLLAQTMMTPVIKLLPKALWEDWLDIVSADFSFRTGHKHFERKGSDMVLMVAPYQLYLLACNAEAIRTIAAKRQQFPKWVETYSILQIFGENVVTTEGAVWKMHRKVTSASFSEENAALVFRETIRQTHGLIRRWEMRDAGGVIKTLEDDTMRLALNIIGYVGFGLRLPWPGQESARGDEPEQVPCESLEAPTGHTFSFVDTLQAVLDRILLLVILPAKLLHKLPFKKAKTAGLARDDFAKYMDELLDQKMAQAQGGGQADEGMDLMGQLARSSYEADAGLDKGVRLTRDEIIGNAFIMLLAGHETTANIIHFAIAELAINPTAQRQLQENLDELLGSAKPDEWDYEALVKPLMGSMAGAVMNETLRMFPPVISVPKVVNPQQDQTLNMDGKQFVLPAGTIVGLEACAIARNPRYWPTQPSKVRRGVDDIADWVPERWLVASDDKETSDTETDSTAEEDFGGFQGPDTSAQLFRPERGAFIPFSAGPRSCLGRRIAQVEVIAALAVIFRDFSIELAVRDEDGEDDATRYQAAQERGRRTLESARSLITLNLHGTDRVPVRLVQRGQERFVSWVDE